MNAIEKLRVLLNERRVDHVDYDGCVEWQSAYGFECRGFSRYYNSAIDIALICIDPEKVVEVTLGRGKCKMNPRSNPDILECSACGEYVATWHQDYEVGGICFCPHCGREVVYE